VLFVGVNLVGAKNGQRFGMGLNIVRMLAEAAETKSPNEKIKTDIGRSA